MAYSQPFRRTFRLNNHISGETYLNDKNYAVDKHRYIRTYLTILEDLKKILEYVEPCDLNLACYSLRIQELYMRTCVEVEANFTAILNDNQYRAAKSKNLNIRDFSKVNRTHYLSDYEVILPFWSTGKKSIRPFEEFKSEQQLSWYRDYNKIKHEKYHYFHKANLDNLLTSVCGLLALLSSQFYIFNFMSNSMFWMSSDLKTPVDALGGFFLIQFPNWPEEEVYDFDWEELSGNTDSFGLLRF